MEEFHIKPLVSICIPAYNARQHISSTLKSLVNQTYKNTEIIVVDDGSLHPCKAEVEAFSDKRIQYIFQENGGAGNARNHAFKLSRGQYIKFMDADDMLSSNAIQAQLNLIEKESDVIISSKWGRFYNDDLATFRLSEEQVWRTMPSVSWIQESWAQGPNMTQPGIFLFKRELIEKAGLWNESLSKGPIDDMEYYTRLILNTDKVIFCSDSTLMYRSGLDDSLSKRKSEKAMETALETIKLATGYLFKHDQTDKSREAISVQFQLFIYNVYPHFMRLYKEAEKFQRNYGPNSFSFAAGGKTKFLKKLFGWKLAKQIKRRFT